MKQPPAAVVFDMDGLLLDTERQALKGFLHACRANGVTPHLPPTTAASARAPATAGN